MDVDAIIREIASGRLREEHLPWQDYQRLVSVIVERQNFDLLASSEVTVSDNEYSGEIDIVIHYTVPKIRVGAATATSKEAIFIECKRRSRKLELDDVGKVFCYSILHQPTALYIISPHPLAPQAISCAHRLFSAEGSESGFFKTAVFHRSLRQLLDIPPDSNEAGYSDVTVDSWSIALEDTFHHEVVADDRDSVASSVIDVPAGATISVNAVLHSTIPIDVKAQLISRRGAIGGQVHVSVSGYSSVEFRFQVGDEPIVIKQLEIIDALRGSKTACRLPAVELHLSSAGTVFGDLRDKEAADFANQLVRPETPRVTAVTGDAGIGKSYFCESVARYLKTKCDFSTLQIIVTQHDDYHLFLPLLRYFFIPIADRRIHTAERRINNDSEATELSILGTALSLVGGQFQSADTFSHLLERIRRGDHDASDPALLLDALASAMRSSPRPHLIVFKNCHLMSSRATVLLKMLVARLESDGWGRTRLLLEYRSESNDESAAWNRAERELTSDLGARFPHLVIKPLTLAELVERVSSHIESPSQHLTAEILLRQAGGNPLFLEHVIRYLLQSQIIVRDSSGGKEYRIDHFELFRRRIEVLPNAIDAFLRYRVQDIIARAPRALRPAMSAYLGIMAVIISSAGASPPSIDESRLSKATNSSPSELRRVRHRLVAEGMMKGVVNRPHADFVHDLMAAAALTAVSSNAWFRDAAFEYLRQAEPDSVIAAIVSGRLSQLLGELSEAVAHYEWGLHSAERSANFLEQRRCLEGIREVLESVADADVIAISKRFNVSLKLIWNELQQGSQYVAAQFIERTINELHAVRSREVSESGIDAYIEREVARYQLVLDTRRADVSKFIEDCLHYIEISDTQDALHYAATRVLLMALHTCEPLHALKAARIAIALLDTKRINALSSLYSDLGHFFFIQNPGNIETLWRAGLDVLERAHPAQVEERQKVHSHVNVAIVDALLRPEHTKADDVARLASDLAGRGLTNQYLRLQNCFGALLFHEGDVHGATAAWTKGLQVARASSTQLYEWPYYHNLALASLTTNNVDGAVDLLRRAARSAESLLPFVARRRPIAAVVTALEKKAKEMLHVARLPAATLGVPLPLFSEVSVSGSIVRLLHAARVVGELSGKKILNERRGLALPPYVDGSPLLAMTYCGQSFALSVE